MANSSSGKPNEYVAEFFDLVLGSSGSCDAPALPHDLDELKLVRRHACDAIAYLREFSSTIKAELSVYDEYQKHIENCGGSPTLDLPEITISEGPRSYATRWELLFNYMTEVEKFGFSLLKHRLSIALHRHRSWSLPLSMPQVIQQLADELGIENADSMPQDEFLGRVSESRCIDALRKDERDVIRILAVNIHCLEQVESRIMEAISEAKEEYTEPMRKYKARAILGDDKRPMSATTYRRKVKNGEIKVKEITSRIVQIRKSDLPSEKK